MNVDGNLNGADVSEERKIFANNVNEDEIMDRNLEIKVVIMNEIASVNNENEDLNATNVNEIMDENLDIKVVIVNEIVSVNNENEDLNVTNVNEDVNIENEDAIMDENMGKNFDANNAKQNSVLSVIDANECDNPDVAKINDIWECNVNTNMDMNPSESLVGCNIGITDILDMNIDESVENDAYNSSQDKYFESFDCFDINGDMKTNQNDVNMSENVNLNLNKRSTYFKAIEESEDTKYDVTDMNPYLLMSVNPNDVLDCSHTNVVREFSNVNDSSNVKSNEVLDSSNVKSKEVFDYSIVKSNEVLDSSNVKSIEVIDSSNVKSNEVLDSSTFNLNDILHDSNANKNEVLDQSNITSSNANNCSNVSQNVVYEKDDTNNLSPSCIHIKNLKSVELLASYNYLHGCYVSGTIPKDFWPKKKSECICYFKSCKTIFKRIYLCLTCLRFTCFKEHSLEHSENYKHPIAMDFENGELYCFICSDFKYDRDFLAIEKKNRKRKLEHEKRAKTIENYKKNVPKWEPTPEEIELLKHHHIEYNPDMGIRGLMNINTEICYLNVNIHCLMYAPAFRDYLLTNKHRCPEGYPKDTIFCFICEFDKILQETYTPAMDDPLICDRFIFALYKRLPEFTKTYDHAIGHDSVECFQEILKKMHEDSGGEDSLGHCKCDIHEIFGISDQLKVECKNCKKVQFSPVCGKRFFHFQLFLYHYYQEFDVQFNSILKKKRKEFRFYVDLKDLLERSFPGVCMVPDVPLDLVFGYSYACPECKATEFTPIQVPAKLPTILNFIIENDEMYIKNMFVKFDEFLDVTPYINASESDDDEKSKFENIYYLCAIIEHIPPGHYKCYVRLDKDRWVLCDNEDTSEIDLNSVLNVKAKVLFYHKLMVKPMH